MNMRRYSMKARRVTALKRLLRNDRIRITRITVAPHEKKEDMVYIFFDNVEEVVAKEKETVARLKEKAEEVAKDEVYAELSNSKQRELYLLDRYGLSKREGVDVIELVKLAEVEASVAMDEKLLTAKVKLEVKEDKRVKGKKEGER
jgi:uncharacterized membrane protein YvbJ